MKQSIKVFAPIAMVLALTFTACKKEIQEPIATTPIAEAELGGKDGNGHLQQTKTFSSDVVRSWLGIQLTMLRIPLPAGVGSQATDRAQAYAGIALYEAVVNGMPAYQTLAGQLNAMPSMPSTQPGKAYHWGASANAALAEINRRLFAATSAANMTAMNQLEITWQNLYAGQVDGVTLQRSIAFGREVATRIANWAAADGSANINPPYVPPVGPGLWVPTAATPPIGPYNYQRRLLVPGVANGTAIQPPPPYSTVPGSPFYLMVQDVFNRVAAITPDQTASSIYFRDNPGYSPGGGNVSLMYQLLGETQIKLDQAALAYAKVGIAQHEATIILFTGKYTYNVIRPVTYIRTVMGLPAWNTIIATPNHPEFPSGHATTSGATLSMFAHVFGDNYPITLHTYDYLGFPTRSYSSFSEMLEDVAMSRVWSGLHYKYTCDKSLEQGRKIAENIINTLEFKK